MTYMVVWTLGQKAKFEQRLGQDRGAGLAEYALLLFVVAVAAATIIGAFGQNIVNAFTGATNELPAAPPAP
ncbi:MAG: hypothetical protein AAGA93_26595 [Actinomycetota bacterium]